ncbi:MAG: aldo/keto reductase [Bacteroidales bacterium]|nr:aldo/keto reductase [Bacteroidales bacterium]HOI31909.1 aldo/keto reductase [Bacteroidales bacterium]
MSIPEILVQKHMSLPKLGIGTWEMGGRHNPDKSEDQKFIHALRFALDQGIRHIDTAEMYGNGHTEELVAKAIQGFDREKLLITSKVSGDHLAYQDVIEAAHNSLKRLQTDYIDLYLLHWPNPEVPVEETMKAINELLEQGKIRNFGLSNFSAAQTEEILRWTDEPIITNQLEYNLFTRNNGRITEDVEAAIIPFCLSKGISITAWRPLMKGAFNPMQQPLINEIAARREATPMQIALAWLLYKPLMLAIPKMTSEKHILENIAATNIILDKQEMRLLDGLAS